MSGEGEEGEGEEGFLSVYAYHTTLIITRGPTLLCELGSLFIANTLLLNCAYYKKSIFYHSLTL